MEEPVEKLLLGDLSRAAHHLFNGYQLLAVALSGRSASVVGSAP
jgi:hypothetical protein